MAWSVAGGAGVSVTAPPLTRCGRSGPPPRPGWPPGWCALCRSCTPRHPRKVHLPDAASPGPGCACAVAAPADERAECVKPLTESGVDHPQLDLGHSDDFVKAGEQARIRWRGTSGGGGGVPAARSCFVVTIQAVIVGGEVRLARTPFGACGQWSACARYGRLINRPCLAAPPEAVSAQADTWREAPEEGDFKRLNSYSKTKSRTTICAINPGVKPLYLGSRRTCAEVDGQTANSSPR